MVTNLTSGRTRIPKSTAIFERCDSVFNLVKDGKDAEAKDLFPLEYYLVKKYLYLNLEVFKKQMENKLNLK